MNWSCFSLFLTFFVPTKKGMIVEVCPQAISLTVQLAKLIEKYSGIAIFIDYGLFQSFSDSLRGVKVCIFEWWGLLLIVNCNSILRVILFNTKYCFGPFLSLISSASFFYYLSSLLSFVLNPSHSRFSYPTTSILLFLYFFLF